MMDACTPEITDARTPGERIRLSLQPLLLTSSEPDFQWLEGKLAAAGWDERRAIKTVKLREARSPLQRMQLPVKVWIV